MENLNFKGTYMENFSFKDTYTVIIVRHRAMKNLILKDTYEPGHEKMCIMSYANNKGADQPRICAV